MVRLTEICFKYMPFYLRYDESRTGYFKRQAIFRLTGTFYGRHRNTYKGAVEKLHKKWQYRTEFRQRRSIHLQDLHAQRLLAACEEHNFKMEYFISTLIKCNIELSRKSLALLATYEPRTFKSLVDFAKTVYHENSKTEEAQNTTPPGTVLTRGMLSEVD